MKTLPPDLKTVLDNAVLMVNFIKNGPLNTRMMHLLCQELNAEEVTPFHPEVRWLSKDKVVARVATLKEELKKFFDKNDKEKQRSLSTSFQITGVS